MTRLTFLYIGSFFTHPMLASFLCGDFFLHILSWLLLFFSFFFFSREFPSHIPCWLHFYAGSFSFTSRTGLFFCGEFLLHILCWLYFSVGCFSYTSHAGFFSSSFFIWEVSLTHPVLASFLCEEFLLHSLYWLYVYLGSFSYTSLLALCVCVCVCESGGGSYTSHPFSFFLMWGVSFGHPMLALFVSGEFLLHIPCWLHFYLGFLIQILCCLQFYARSFSYTFRAGFFFLFFFYLGSFSYSYHASLLFIGGAFLTHPVLASFLSRECLLHIPCWLHFYAGSFSYTSHAVVVVFVFCFFVFVFLSEEFLLHI